MMHRRFMKTMLLILVLSACSSLTPAPFPTEIPQPVIQPTFTELPATSTPGPVNTPTLTMTIESDTGASLSYWNDIPLIPGAKDGLQMDSSYMYSVNITLEEAEQFYKENLEANGWTLSIRETGPDVGGNAPLLLVFEKDQELIRILLMGTDNLSIMLERVKL